MEDIGPYIERGSLLLQQGKPKEAEKQFSMALRFDPENHYVLAQLAKCKIDLKELKAASELIESAIRHDPSEDYYFYLAAFINYQQDQNARALLQLQTALSLNASVAAYYGLWSTILIEEKQFKTALEKADEGLYFDATDLTCLNARATALNKLKRTDDAVATMQHALAQDPDNDITHTTVAWNLLEKGKHREAVTHFKEALRLNPQLEYARSGLKEALKSRVAPYRWLLQYNFWVTNKSKNARWIIPIALFIGVRLFAGASAAGGAGWKILGGVVLGLYLLFVATSWIINPLANFFLLFDKDGKYAVTNNEKWNAISFTTAIAAGLLLVIVSLLLPEPVAAGAGVLAGGLIVLSLAIPLGHMQFPWNLRGRNFLQWYSICLVVVGALTALFCCFSTDPFPPYAVVYVVAFVAYMWVHAFAKR